MLEVFFRSCWGLVRSWAVLGRSWGGLGPSWAVLGRSWSGLGWSWVLLWRSWSRLGAILGRLGSHLELKNVDFPCVFQYFLKNHTFHIISLPKPSWDPTWGNLELQEPPKRSPRSGLGRSWGGLGRSWGGLGAIFGWSWGGLGRSDRDRFGRKIVPKPINIQDGLRRRIWIDLGSVGGSILGGFGVDWGGFSGFFLSFLEVARSREEMCHKCPASFFQEANSLKGDA